MSAQVKPLPFAEGDRVTDGSRHATVQSCSWMSNGQPQMTVLTDEGTLLAPLAASWSLVDVDEFRVALLPLADSMPLRQRRANAMVNLRTLAVMRVELERTIAANVAQARVAGAQYYDYGSPTWAQIGSALGVTKQAAQARYGKRE